MLLLMSSPRHRIYVLSADENSLFLIFSFSFVVVGASLPMKYQDVTTIEGPHRRRKKAKSNFMCRQHDEEAKKKYDIEWIEYDVCDCWQWKNQLVSSVRQHTETKGNNHTLVHIERVQKRSDRWIIGRIKCEALFVRMFSCDYCNKIYDRVTIRWATQSHTNTFRWTIFGEFVIKMFAKWLLKRTQGRPSLFDVGSN